MTQSFDDLYALLQVHPKAGEDVIKKAYYTLMHKIHPDKGGNDRLAQQLNLAYETLSNPQKRQAYDRKRAAILVNSIQQRKLAAEPSAPPPVQPFVLQGQRRSPALFGSHILVADERGHRVLILDQQGDIVWEHGKESGNRLIKPGIAQFTPQGTILIVDSGNHRIIEVNLKHDILWTFSAQDCPAHLQAKFKPIFVHVSAAGKIVITDTGNRCVLQLNKERQPTWEYHGKASFNLKLWNFWIKPEYFMPVTAYGLNDGNILITDQGNGRILEVAPQNNLRWIYPLKKTETLRGVNSAVRLENGHTWLISDKIVEVNKEGKMVWDFQQFTDADIRQAYRLEDGSFLVDMVHLVKRGVNQEVLLLNQANKILSRHYYSQHRSI